MITCPCKYCDKHQGCNHDNCEGYRAWKAEQQKACDKARNDRYARDFLASNSVQRIGAYRYKHKNR